MIARTKTPAAAAEPFVAHWNGAYGLDAYRKRRVHVLARNDFRCVYCGYDFLSSPAALLFATTDHFEPKVAGGDDRPGNLVASCSACNAIKGAMRAETLEKARELVLRRRALYLAEILETLVALRAPFPRHSDPSGEPDRTFTILAGLLDKRAEVVWAAAEMVERLVAEGGKGGAA